jgi:hypothetical protein
MHRLVLNILVRREPPYTESNRAEHPLVTEGKAMASQNAERLKQYKARLRAAGFKRLSFWVCADLAAMLAAERRPCECGGRTLERLLLGRAAKRPQYGTGCESPITNSE